MTSKKNLKDQKKHQTEAIDKKAEDMKASQLSDEETTHQLKECEKKCADYKDKYLRALADYRNVEQRAIVEKVEARISAEKDILKRMLPFLDNLKRAEIFIKDEGLQMIKKDFERTLEEIGIQEVDLFEKPFDPAYAEVIEVVKGEEDNIVVEVVLNAYVYKDTILRHGQVKVSQKDQS